MSVVDETSRVPPLDQAALSRLAAALDLDGVAAVFLSGSQARGSAGPLSDVDLAVLMEPGAPASLRLKLASLAGAALGTGEVDVIALNGASPLLRHRVARDGRLLLDRDPAARIAFKAEALRDYLDTAPLRFALHRGLRRRLEEDRFGRP
ncbi:MAG TPA: nucleotidyltransferase domain-containing protein [Solirubrobacterales bacterium]|nr:nucleotidyltransferase domain-containing protein [Solirubrobacterales bacterium]